VVGGPDLTIAEAEKAAELVGEKINPQARIIWGCSIESELEKTVRTLLVITGVKSKAFLGKESGSSIRSSSSASEEDIDVVR